MASGLIPIVLDSPGTMGLNTQDSDKTQDHRFATLAENCVISKNGLIESRKGAGRLNGTAATGAPDIDVVYSYVKDDGTEIIVSTGGNKIWTGTTSLTDKTGTLTVTADDWHFQTYKGEVFGYQSGHAPIYYDGGAGAFVVLSGKGTAAGLVNSKLHLAAWGRSWVVDVTNLSLIKYSDLLVPEAFTGGSSGTLDLDTVWPGSNDTITALAAFNNSLVVFGERSVVVFNNGNDVTNLSVASTTDSLNVIGCIARDSVQQVGNDLFYLSNDGVRSLSRTVIQDNLPLGEISAPIRDDMIASINTATAGSKLGKIRSTYNEQEGFYAINFPGDKVYICDVRLAGQGIYRWTTWTGDFFGLATGKDDALYIGLDSGYLAQYADYYDTDTSDGDADLSYVMKFKTGWIDVGSNAGESIWKKAVLYIASLINLQATLLWALDYSETEKSATKAVTGDTVPVYGTAVYGTAKYGGNFQKQRLNYTLNNTGSVIRLGFQSVVMGGKFAFNKIDLFMKAGRIR